MPGPRQCLFGYEIAFIITSAATVPSSLLIFNVSASCVAVMVLRNYSSDPEHLVNRRSAAAAGRGAATR
jgi:hypothetical protein